MREFMNARPAPAIRDGAIEQGREDYLFAVIEV
jgi:hypothetical protein